MSAETSETQCAAYGNTATGGAVNHPDVSDGGSITCDPPGPEPPGPEPPLPPPPLLPDPPPTDPELDIDKVASLQRARAGQRVNFRLTTQNTGGRAARNVAVCDRLPAGLVFASTRGATVDGRRLCFTARRVNPGRSRTFTVHARAARMDDGRQVLNVAAVTADGERSGGARPGFVCSVRGRGG